jgi:hypothetical protein
MWRLQCAVALEQGIFVTGHREKIDSIDSGHHESRFLPRRLGNLRRNVAPAIALNDLRNEN